MCPARTHGCQNVPKTWVRAAACESLWYENVPQTQGVRSTFQIAFLKRHLRVLVRRAQPRSWSLRAGRIPAPARIFQSTNATGFLPEPLGRFTVRDAQIGTGPA